MGFRQGPSSPTGWGWLAGCVMLLSLSLSLVAPGAGPEATDGRLQQLLARFPDADLNKDGKLTREEFAEYRKKRSEGTGATSRPSAATQVSPPAAARPEASAGKLAV